MEKDKIILISKKDYIVLKGNNTDGVVTIEIKDNNLTFCIYEDISAEQIAFKKGFSVKNTKNVRIIEFDDEIYLRSKSDKEAIAPICIEECGETLNIIDLLECDCDELVENMKGDKKQIEQNFDIVEGRPFLMEDEFSL